MIFCTHSRAAICDIAKAAKRLDKKCGMLKVTSSSALHAQFSLSAHQDRLESTTTAAEQLAKVLGGVVCACRHGLTILQGKSGLESVLQDNDDCAEDKENRTFQKMVVRAVKK